MRIWRLGNLLLLVLIFGGLAAVLFPGRFDGDAITQYRMGLGLEPLHDIHAPMMAWLLGRLAAIAPGPAPMFCLQLLLWFLGLALLTDRLIEAGRPATAVTISALTLLPLTAFEAVEIQKDMLFTATAVLITALGLRAQLSQKPLTLTCTLGLLILFAIAIDLRQNALFLLLGLAFLFVPIRAAAIRPVARAAALCAALLLAAGAAADSFDHDMLHAERKHIVYALYVFDLAGISVRTHTDPTHGLLPDFLRAAERCYTPRWWDPFLSGACASEGAGAGRLMADPRTRTALRNAWLTAILSHPGAYARHRLHHFGCFLGAYCPERTQPRVMSGGVSWTRRWETTPYQPTKAARALETLANQTAAGPLGNGTLWLAALSLAALLATRTLRRRGFHPLPYATLILASSAAFYTLMFALIGIADALRYLHAVIVLTTIALPLAVSLTIRPQLVEHASGGQRLRLCTPLGPEGPRPHP